MLHSTLVWGNEKELANRSAFPEDERVSVKYSNVRDWVFQVLKEAVVNKGWTN